VGPYGLKIAPSNPLRKFFTLETSMGMAMSRTLKLNGHGLRVGDVVSDGEAEMTVVAADGDRLTVCWFDAEACWEAEVDASRVRLQARA
jgi:hypothetical protein